MEKGAYPTGDFFSLENLLRCPHAQSHQGSNLDVPKSYLEFLDDLGSLFIPDISILREFDKELRNFSQSG